MKIRKPDYKAATFQAHRTFRLYTNHIYPVNPLSIINKMHNTELATYREFAEEIGKPVEYVASHIGKNDDAFTLNRGNEFIIVYNSDTRANIAERIRFSIAHEIGHILMEHFSGNDLILTRGGLTEKKYLLLEKEADTFARELLAPSFIMDPSWPIEKIRDTFDVSKSVAEISLNSKIKYPWIKPTFALLDIHKANGIVLSERKSTVELICRDLNDFLDDHGFITRLFYPVNYYFCKDCKNVEKTYIKEINFCPVCGTDDLLMFTNEDYYIFHETKEKEYMAYTKLEVDNDGRLAEDCPICGNDHVRDNYCSVCGVDIINRCSGIREIGEGRNVKIEEDMPCEQTLLGADRYCSKCGCESTFYRNGLLPAWDKKELKLNVIDGVIDISDDDLPF